MAPLTSPELREQARGLTQLLAAFRHADEVLARAELAQEQLDRLGPELARLEDTRQQAETALIETRTLIAKERADLETALATAKELHGRELAAAAEDVAERIAVEQRLAETALAAIQAKHRDERDRLNRELARLREQTQSEAGEALVRAAGRQKEIDTLDAQLAKLKADLRALGIDPAKLLATVPTGG